MRRIPIGFRELLERVLPLDALSRSEQERLRTQLANADLQNQEDLALYWIEELVRRGVLRRLPILQNESETRVRYQVAESIEVVSLRFDTPSPGAGLQIVPRQLAQLSGSPPVAQLQQLNRLSRELLEGDGSSPTSDLDLLKRIEQAAVEIIGCETATYVSLSDEPGQDSVTSSPSLGGHRLSRWVSIQTVDAGEILLCPKVSAQPFLKTQALENDLGSLAAIPIRPQAGGARGYLELGSQQPGFFALERAALLTEAAEEFSSYLTRASRLEDLVFIDALTGAFNVRYFHSALAAEVARARRDGKSMALCIADIDNFKKFNSDFGYEGGNEVLVEVVKVLRGGVRPFDLVARWGGEEFALILSAPVGREEAETVANRLRSAVADNVVPIIGLDGKTHHVHVTISVGIALFRGDADTKDELWNAANQALLVAKRPPKNRTVFYSDLEGGSETKPG